MQIVSVCTRGFTGEKVLVDSAAVVITVVPATA